jgi:oligopeptide/dipeptide ABC transporter ATP-binding protein
MPNNAVKTEPAADNLILQVRDLSKTFPVKGGVMSRIIGGVKAVEGVSLDILRDEVFGLVGESGCGKTTLGRMILRLIEPSRGQVLFDGTDITELDRNRMRVFRKRMQIIFQDPFGSLNPRKTIGSIVGEPLHIAGLTGAEVRKKVEEMVDLVGLPQDSPSRYPHEFSGGQRQRIGIARALILHPEFLVADEPVSALDVSIQAQILNLLMDLKEHLSFTVLFISHDLRVVRSICDRVAVMYLGRVVEEGKVENIYKRPVHPYTEELIRAIPEPDPEQSIRSEGLPGEVPSPMDPPPGCAFHPRCPLAKDICSQHTPELTPRTGEGHLAACHVR